MEDEKKTLLGSCPKTGILLAGRKAVNDLSKAQNKNINLTKITGFDNGAQIGLIRMSCPDEAFCYYYNLFAVINNEGSIVYGPVVGNDTIITEDVQTGHIEFVGKNETCYVDLLGNVSNKPTSKGKAFYDYTCGEIAMEDMADEYFADPKFIAGLTDYVKGTYSDLIAKGSNIKEVKDLLASAESIIDTINERAKTANPNSDSTVDNMDFAKESAIAELENC